MNGAEKIGPKTAAALLRIISFPRKERILSDEKEI